MTRVEMAEVAERRLKAIGLKSVYVVKDPKNYEVGINGRYYRGNGFKSGAELAYWAYAKWFEDFMGVPLALSYGTWKRSSNYELRRAQNGK